MSMGVIDEPCIFETAELGLSEIPAHEERNVTLMLPCVTRYIMSAPNQEGGLRLIKDTLAASDKPYMMGYSGEEICPMQGADGKWRNRFHNYSFCAGLL